jgi:site-specific DNA-methyltransferase (adenine-specific)
MDPYSFASEVALHQLSVNFDVTVDGILCDPELAAQFDHIAEQFAPGHTPFEYRWAALALRKRAKLAKRAARDYQDWLEKKLPDTQPIAGFNPADYDTAGVYVLIGRGKVDLYIGETFNLGERIEQIAAIESWQELDPTVVRFFPESEGGLHGLKSVLIQRLNPALNSQLLFPRLETVA